MHNLDGGQYRFTREPMLTGSVWILFAGVTSIALPISPFLIDSHQIRRGRIIVYDVRRPINQVELLFVARRSLKQISLTSKS
jgi:hypothetical protein